jgi:hypothetical protein
MSTVAHLSVAPAPTPDRLEKLLTDGHRGIAFHCPDAASAHAVAGWPEGSWKLLADRGALVSFNATPEAHPGLAELVSTYTGCPFLFSHDRPRMSQACCIARRSESRAWIMDWLTPFGRACSSHRDCGQPGRG